MRCRENVENVVVADNVSCLLDLAHGTPYKRSKHALSPPGIITLSTPSFPATLVANSAIEGIISVWHLNSFFPFKDAYSIKQKEAQVENIWRQKIPRAVCC